MHKLVYTDEKDLLTYQSLPSNDFKEFFMAYFRYKKGDKIEITDFSNPITFALFNTYIPKLEKNEEVYTKKVNANRENGKKGGRPKKNQNDLETDDLRHDNFENDTIYQQGVESPSEGLKEGKFEDFEKEFNNVIKEEVKNDIQNNVEFDDFFKKNEHKINNIVNLKSSPIQISRKDGQKELEKLLKITPKDMQMNIMNIIDNKLNKYQLAI